MITEYRPSLSECKEQYESGHITILKQVPENKISKIIDQLAPCPFCGKKEGDGIPTLFYGIKGARHIIQCIPCSIIMDDDRKDKVICNWNTRGGIHPITAKQLKSSG